MSIRLELARELCGALPGRLGVEYERADRRVFRKVSRCELGVADHVHHQVIEVMCDAAAETLERCSWSAVVDPVRDPTAIGGRASRPRRGCVQLPS